MGIAPRIAIGSAIVAGVFACSLVTTYDGFRRSDAPPPCGKRVPERPVGGPSGGEGKLQGVVSVIQFVDEPDAAIATLGFDTDGLCTCPERAACLNRDEGTKGPCDDLGDGIDNAAGRIISLLYQGDDTGGQTLADDDLARGTHGTLIDVGGWNGGPEDADVTVALYNVAGVKNGPARFDGTDEILVAEGSLLDPTFFAPRYYDAKAYVTGGVLVASLDYDLRLVVEALGDSLSEVTLPMRSAHLVGHLRATSGGVEILDAQLVGRLLERDMFTQLSHVGVCHDAGLYPPVRDRLCAALDMPASPSADGKDSPCDAISFAIGLSFRPAKLAGSAPTPVLPLPCGDEPPDECN